MTVLVCGAHAAEILDGLDGALLTDDELCFPAGLDRLRRSVRRLARRPLCRPWRKMPKTRLPTTPRTETVDETRHPPRLPPRRLPRRQHRCDVLDPIDHDQFAHHRVGDAAAACAPTRLSSLKSPRIHTRSGPAGAASSTAPDKWRNSTDATAAANLATANALRPVERGWRDGGSALGADAVQIDVVSDVGVVVFADEPAGVLFDLGGGKSHRFAAPPAQQIVTMTRPLRRR